MRRQNQFLHFNTGIGHLITIYSSIFMPGALSQRVGVMMVGVGVGRRSKRCIPVRLFQQSLQLRQQFRRRQMGMDVEHEAPCRWVCVVVLL